MVAEESERFRLTVPEAKAVAEPSASETGAVDAIARELPVTSNTSATMTGRRRTLVSLMALDLNTTTTSLPSHADRLFRLVNL